MRGTRLAGLLLLGAGGLQLLALGFPLLSGQPALGTDDAALVVQVPLGIVLLGAGFFLATRAEPFDQGLAVGLGVLLGGRLAVLVLTAVDRDLDVGAGYVMIVGGCGAAAAAAAIAGRAARLPVQDRRLPVAAALAALLGAATFALSPSEGFDLVFDGSIVDLAVVTEIAAAVGIPVLAARRESFGAGMVGGEAAVVATLVAGTFAADLGVGFGTWCSIGAVASLVTASLVLAQEPDDDS